MTAIPLVLCATGVLGIGFLLTLVFGKRLKGGGSEIAIAATTFNTLLAFIAALAWNSSGRIIQNANAPWFVFGDNQVSASVSIDTIAIVMLCVVAPISLLVNLFSARYMHDDRRRAHFFAFLLLFSAAMQLFIISGNTLQIVFGWEVMALCSFLLIGHWWEEKHNVAAAMKAFLTTRVSDMGLLVGMAILFFAANETFDVATINEHSTSGLISHGVLVAGAVALFIAVIGKSAQFPLHTWLPDAMAGPTPMSALIHAATMVVAGVFLMLRLFPVFDNAFAITTAHGGVNPIVLIGAITIVIAALLAFLQRDIKKVLSYSTVSQLGFMVAAIGAGATSAAIFHLVVHAFAKAALFLAAGSISRSVHGYDLRRDMGGLRKALPITHALFAIAALTLVGVVPLAGFWSKGAIIEQMMWFGYTPFAFVVVAGTLLTAGYMGRMYYLAFWGPHQAGKVVRESPASLSIPTAVLCVASIGSTFAVVLVPHYEVHSFTHSVLQVAEAVVPFVGLIAAAALFKLGLGPRSWSKRFAFARPIYRIIWNRYYLDWFYEHVIANTVRKSLAFLVHSFDLRIVDALGDSIARQSVRAGHFVVRRLDAGAVDASVNATAGASVGAGALLGRLQRGRIQRFISLLIFVIAVAAAVLVWTVK